MSRTLMMMSVAMALMLTVSTRAQQTIDGIFRDRVAAIADQPVGTGIDPTAVIRSRTIDIDKPQLTNLKSGDAVMLNLFDDVWLNAVVDAARTSSVETSHIRGTIDGSAGSSVLIVVHRSAVTGIIRAPGFGTFRVRTAGDRGLVIEELDIATFLPCGTGPEHRVSKPADAAAALGPPPEPEPQCATFVDVMIVYTPEARVAEGGVDPIEALAILAVDETNAAFVNSAITARARLVHIAETDYVETGSFGTELNRLRETADGFMDDVHPLRDQYGADVVTLLISHTQMGTICGIAYLMSPLSAGFDVDAFNVCNTGCVLGGYTFEHELGHNMGCAHDRDNAGGPGAFSYSYGHRFEANDFIEYRTIMSYAPGERISYFSNPNVVYLGTPTGVAEAEPNSADNARTINETAATVMGFRSVAVPFTLGPVVEDTPQNWPVPIEIISDDLAEGDNFGISVALHGELMIVGSYLADTMAADAGAAYVFRYDSKLATWTQEAKLFADDGAFNDRLGVSVDIFDDGKSGGWAAVGAYLDDDGGRDSGAAYIFRRSGSSWSQEEKLVADDDGGGDLFGRSVSIASNAEGEFVLIGSYLDDDENLNSGAAYVFHKPVDGEWTQQQKLKAIDASAQDQFGFSVAMTASPTTGNLTAVIGAWRDDELGHVDTGSAYIFDRVGGVWAQRTKLLHSTPEPNDQFGYAVDIDATEESTAAIVSAWIVDGAALNTGAAYVFREHVEQPPPPKKGEPLPPPNIAWVQEAKLTSGEPGLNDRFGSSVAISGSGALVGAYLKNIVLDDVGAAYVFRKRGLGWVAEARLTHENAVVEDEFGFSAALRGGRAAIGAWQRTHSEALELTGAVYVYQGVPITDCNENQVDDECDIFLGTSEDLNANGIPDECEKGDSNCPADIAPPGGDGAVGVPDLLAIINGWGACPPLPATCPADIAPPGGDGAVGVPDLLAIINGWGACPPPP